jgi:hypothetical protein
MEKRATQPAQQHQTIPPTRPETQTTRQSYASAHSSAITDQRLVGAGDDLDRLTVPAVLHARHGLPAAQISRLLEISSVAVKHHINQLRPLFTEYGHPPAPSGRRIKRPEELTTQLQPYHRPRKQHAT